jgi:hypothetical protein
MPKGYFTQCAVILAASAPSIQGISTALGAFPQRGVVTSPASGWMGGAEQLHVDFRTEANGAVLVDVLPSPWPDGMGNPESEPELFGAWGMGFMGPFTFPGGLTRAVQQSWGWDQAAEVVSRHQAFIRIRTTYVVGARDSDPVLPPQYEPLPELTLMTQLAQALLRLPEALCYFNPSGETLHTAATLGETLAFHEAHGLPPLDVWSNVRLFNAGDGWKVMDTVGMDQLDVVNQEAVFTERYDPTEVANLLRKICFYLMQKGPVIRPKDTMDGPGGVRWQAFPFEKQVVEPPRPVLRWFPLDGTQAPAGVRP